MLLSELLPALSPYGFSSAVVLPRSSKLAPVLEKANITLLFAGKADNAFSVSDILSYLGLFHKKPPDLVVSHGSLSAKLAAKLLSHPCVSVKHCDLPVRHPRLYRALTDATVATSLPCARHLTEEGIFPVACIENGFSPVGAPTEAERETARAALSIPSGAIAIGLCARLAPVKGHETAIRALSLLGEEGRPLRLLFLGDGEERERLRALSRALGVTGQVHFLGFSAETKGFYHALDAHLSCSLASETSSLSLAEGMSAALPTVASDTEGNRARVSGGGLLYPVGDASALAECFRLLLRRRERERLRSAAIYRAAELPSFTETARAYAAVFAALTAKKEKNGCFFHRSMLQ